MRQLFRNIVLVSIGLIAGIAATIQFSATAQHGTSTLPLDELRTLSTVVGQIKREYVEPIDDKQLLTDAVKGMVSSLDPHSAYLDKKDFAEMQEQTAGKFAGLGIEITSEDGLVKVLNPIEGSPAAKAGLQAGDLITRLDDKPVRGMSLDKAVRTMAEMENLKRRTQKDLEDAHKYSLTSFGKELLPVYDSVVLGLQAATGDNGR